MSNPLYEMRIAGYPVGVDMSDVECSGRPKPQRRDEPELDEEEWLGEE